jgi:hypothetical protein
MSGTQARIDDEPERAKQLGRQFQTPACGETAAGRRELPVEPGLLGTGEILLG